jgi:hypothetical protein
MLVYEVNLDVVPLYISSILLGSPYIYDRMVIFFQKENKYHLTKYGVEYIVKAYCMEANPSLINAGQMKRVIHTCNNLLLTIVKNKETDKSNPFDALNPLHKHEILEMRWVFQWGGG